VRPPEESLRFVDFAGFLEKPEQRKSMSRVPAIPKTVLTPLVLFLKKFNLVFGFSISIIRFLYFAQVLNVSQSFYRQS
jgi:hypothetical protein